MLGNFGHVVFRISKAFCIVAVLCASISWASVAGSISGTAKDPSGRVVPKAEITIHETSTGLSYHATANSKGYYTLPVLPVGHYELEAQSPGFRSYQRKDIVLDTNASLTVDVAFELGSVNETVSVTDDTLHVETISTQMGEVITGRQMTAVPLNGRSYTDLLSLQAGVAPATSITSSTVQDVGATVLNPSGTLNPGTVSVNGQNEFSNFFSVNGSDVEEDVNGGTAIVPNLDAIAEFRIITSNFDAEYGEFSGGQISVITKSGTNAFHGSAFEFLRNTDLDARNYFSPTRGAFRQNQFGGTFGGPVRKDKAFFFIDYQGTRQTQGVDTGNISVPSNADRLGNLWDFTNGPGGNMLSGAVGGPYFANLLTQKLGYGVNAGEPYYVPGCTTSAQCVFPNATIPQNAWSTPAQRLLQYIPAPNTASGTFATSSFNQTVRDDKAGARIDVNTRIGLISAYYFIDDFNLDNPYPVAQSGASVPGFDALTTGRAQLFSLGDTKTFSASSINEFHLSFMRNLTNLGQPVGGRNVSLASQGFVNPDGTTSIVPLDPKGQSVMNLNFNGYSTGAAANQLIQANNTYQVTDVFSKVIGRHTLKFGGEFHADQVNGAPIAQFNGNFVFTGTETGVDFADFLIGVPSQYNQSQLNPFYARNKYAGLFAQDSFHVLPNLTLNYGLRWDRVTPWSERYNQISTFVAGAQSTVFPGAPPGILYPGDPGIPDTLAPISNRSFAPRVGLAWSPQSDSSFLQKILGAPGSTSIRASYGNFYTAIPALSIGVLAANAPYGTTYTSPQAPLFATPFVNAADGQSNGQPFPYTFAPLNSSRSNPDPNIDWSTFEPIEGIPGYDIHNKIPYTEEWVLSIERQLGPNTVFSASYLGTSSHRQLVLIEPNPGNPALCLSLSQPNQVQPGTLTCGPGGEDTVYFPIGGGQVNGTRGPLGSNFGSNALQSTLGHANYNALELSARHTSGRLEFSVAYTYAKSLDQSSNLGEEVNPFNPSLSYAISSFDVKHNFVISYEYQLPFDQFLHPNRLTNGWSLSGITHFATGFPITVINNGDNSLIGTNPNGINNSSIDEPDYNGSGLKLNHNPRNGKSYFDTTTFSMNALGTPGTAKRRFFYGPGTDNFDMAIGKRTAITESKALLIRVEAFNVFNHTQFSGPSSVDGDIGSSTFGDAISAAPPRILQGAAKFTF
jgi:Carboxypeptidase regulatory-like domain